MTLQPLSQQYHEGFYLARNPVFDDLLCSYVPTKSGILRSRISSDTLMNGGTLTLKIIGVVILSAIALKLIVVIISLPLEVSGWMLTILNTFLIIFGICLGVLSFLFLLDLIVLFFKKLTQQLGTYFKTFNDKLETALRDRQEKILPIILTVISETSILVLSSDFTSPNTKIFLSLMLSILLGIILVTAARERGRVWGAVIVILLVLLTGGLLCLKNGITSFYSGYDLLYAKFQQVRLQSTTIDFLAVGLVSLTFVLLIILSVINSVRKSTKTQEAA